MCPFHTSTTTFFGGYKYTRGHTGSMASKRNYEMRTSALPKDMTAMASNFLNESKSRVKTDPPNNDICVLDRLSNIRPSSINLSGLAYLQSNVMFLGTCILTGKYNRSYCLCTHRLEIMSESQRLSRKYDKMSEIYLGFQVVQPSVIDTA